MVTYGNLLLVFNSTQQVQLGGPFGFLSLAVMSMGLACLSSSPTGHFRVFNSFCVCLAFRSAVLAPSRGYRYIYIYIDVETDVDTDC